jgi:hypothetical protein
MVANNLGSAEFQNAGGGQQKPEYFGKLVPKTLT